jgi:hypothetical protein
VADERQRRTILRWTGGVVAVGLAGCAGRSAAPPVDGTTAGTPATATDTGTADDATTGTETTTATRPTEMSTVFHFAAGTGSQTEAIANVSNLLADSSTDVEDVVLVANGRGIELLATETSEFPDRVTALAEEGVSFRACRNSMEALDVSESDLLDVVETVPAGVGELTRLQATEGYAYIETP